MKNRTISTSIVIVAIILLTTGHAFAIGPYAPPAGQSGTTAIHKDNASFVSWANGWTNYVVGANVDAGWQTPNNALGQAVGSSYDIVCLGNGGQITLTFPNPIVNGTGYDFAVFENSFNHTFLELGWVEVSGDGTNFVRFPNDSLTASPVSAFGSVDATNIDGLAGKYIQGYGTPFDLDSIPAGSRPAQVTHVRIVDIVGDGNALDTTGDIIYDPHLTTGSGGFDLDAVGVINESSSVNQSPTDITMSSQQVLEEQSSGTTVGTLSAEDPDAGDTHTFSLVSGSGDTDNASFTINGSTLLTNAVFDYETKKSYSIRVQANDGNGGTYEEALTIGVIYRNADHHAGLVLDYGNGTVETICVDLGDDGQATGWDALAATGRDIESEDWAVCNIETVGCPSNDCLCGWDDEPYEAWNYWHLASDSSAWVFAGDAASEDTIVTGDVDAWSWGEWSSTEPSLYTFDEICHKHVTSDFNGDATADILWRNSSTGDNTLWVMSNGATSQTPSITNRGTTWNILAINDFNNDLRTDIFWQNSSTGSNEVWLMDGSTVLSQTDPGATSSTWKALGAGDLNNDADADMAWIDTSTSQVYVSLMSNGDITSSTLIDTMSSPWKLIAFDDFNNDSKADFVWQNTSTGVITLWFMDGATRTSTQTTNSSTSVALGAGDINGDGKADLVWRYTTTIIGVWFMNGASVLSTTTAYVPVSYTVAGIEDLNGDGQKDILWRNASTGANTFASWSGSAFTNTALTSKTSPWKAVVPGVNVQNTNGGAALVSFEQLRSVFIGSL